MCLQASHCFTLHRLLLLLLCCNRYHDCFMDDVYINIVMEYCNAGDLTGLLKQRGGQRLPEPEIMSLFVQVGAAGGVVAMFLFM
jgi:serine/threonine protein kinase